jgi:hypothetical protein
MKARTKLPGPRLEMIFVRPNSLSITYILAPAPTLLFPTMLYMPRKAIHTNHEIGRTDFASGAMGVNSTVGSSDGDTLHA